HGVDLTRYRLVTSVSNRLPNRTDHAFEWEEPGAAAGEGRFRLAIVVRGDQVARFLPYVKTPEAFDRALAGRGPAELLFPILGGAVLLALGVAVSWHTLWLARAGGLPARPAAAVAAAGAALYLVQRANDWPAALAAYSSTYSLLSWAISQASLAVQT